MSINSYFSKKLNISVIYNIDDLKKRMTGLELALIMHFINKIVASPATVAQEIWQPVIIDFSKLKNHKIMEACLIYVENSIVNYRKYEKEKVKMLVFLIEWYVQLYWDTKLKDYPECTYLLINKKIRQI